MDGRTAETGDDETTSEAAAAGLCLQLDLGDSGSYVFQLALALQIVKYSHRCGELMLPQLPLTSGAQGTGI